MRRSSPGTMLVALLIAGACSKATEGPVPTTIAVTPAGTLSFASVNQTQQLRAKVLDQHGDSLPGFKVTWSTTSAAVATVDTSGLVTARGNGTATITATSGSLHQDVACQVAQVATAITAFAGNAQVFTVGSPLPVPLDVRASDALGSPVAGVTVSFVVTVGGGSLTPASATTNASGDATTTWTLGTAAGPQQVVASAAALGSVLFTATANPGSPKGIAVNAGNNQTWVINGTLPIAPSVKVTDQYANPVPNAQVVFSVTAGGGSVKDPTQSTNASGIATVGSWTLGGSSGTNTLQAALTGAAATTSFTATAQTPGAPASVTLLAGDNQTGLVGYAVNVRPAVKVTDSGGLPVAGATVTFAVTGGGGSVTGAAPTTAPNGVAQVGAWTLGASPGANSLTATVTDSGVTGNPVKFSATGASATFDITIQNIGPPFSAAARSALDSAVAKWQRIIYQDIPDIANFTAAANTCGPSPAIGPVNVDDILILVKIDSIDGPGRILGQSGPCYIRSSGFQTIMGIIYLDSADVATLITNNQLRDVITHEMGHTLGFGTLWGPSYYGCLQNPSSAGTFVDTYYSCASARAMFDSIGGTSYTGGNKVPVENCAGIPGCGAGTFNSHWRESVFTTELMTGYISPVGTQNPLSVLTIASMADEGYTVNNAAADPYTQTFSVLAPFLRALPGQQLDLGDDVLHIPIRMVDRSGRVVRVMAPQ